MHRVTVRHETPDTEWENQQFLPNCSEFDLFMFVFSISNNLCLASNFWTQLLSPVSPASSLSPLGAALWWVREAGYKWDSPILIIACVSPDPGRPATALSPPGVMSLCVFVFIRAGHCKETPGLSDSQPSVSVTVSLCIRISSLEWGHWAENTDH